ncbi:amino acid adenylation domain-containing protein [Burkholderia cenocepacia]|uniref:amino acid adenylation domain-containing protein n=1 Tax=Burkholderia cenocepacia TaxID=95486 RepID=UPI00285FFE19|nr:amino acid adenylation domain-containing protein [Burkholderia cenocepacia]MDR8050745.1 amino acid adenylation domain-containing protein [Burkholderia cenocepacia]MDV3097134.1 amino acid adenylation domain-containing protein [Burkholderia cenocepacia]
MLLEELSRHRGLDLPPPSDPLLQMLCCAAERSPDKTAIIDSQGAHSYRELFARAKEFAETLQGANVGPNATVALSMRKEFSYVQAVLGCLLSGNAFLPIDPTYPLERANYMIEDAGAVACAINLDMCARVQTPILIDTRALPQNRSAVSDLALRLTTAYTIYTSGTTGRPKGVPITSSALARFIATQGEALNVTEGSRFASVSSISFDMSIWEMFMALCHGASIVMLDRDTIVDGRKLGAALKDHAVSHVLMTPSMLSLLPADTYPALRYVVSAGEKCDPQTVATWSGVSSFFDAYGATEATIYTTIIRKTPDTPLACVGLPMAGSEIAIVGDDGRRLKQRETGEICIVGNAVSYGYHNRPELNTRVFGVLENKRFYRTGDIGYLDDAGRLYCKGRADRQVKFNGSRIELEEIERVSNQTDLVTRSVATLHTTGSGKTFLYLFTVPKVRGTFSVNSFRAALRAVLPGFMMPSRIFTVPEIPLTSNGKVDIPRLTITSEEG